MTTSFTSIADQLDANLREKARDAFSDPLVLQTQAAELLDVSVSTLSRWRASGRGPKAVRLGGKIRYRLSELRAFIDRSEIGFEGSDPR
jgi:predicted DNA-binding transcriptional regulator AlpA